METIKQQIENLEAQAKNARQLQYNASQMHKAGQVMRIEKELETIYRKIDQLKKQAN